MNLFGVFVCTLFVLEGGSARNYPGLCPQIKIRFGRVKYKQRGKIARFVCNIGYTLAGERYNVCTAGRWDNNFPKCVRATCKDPKPPVNGLIYPALGGAVLNFYCKSGYQLRGANITYCDGDRWDNPLPTCTESDSKPSLVCNFETETICGWNHDLNHDFDWKRLNFATPSGSIGTGPTHDHTKGSGKDGHYMYIESSARNINDTARLLSPVYDKDNETVCLEFYYHMYGVSTGDLRVYLKRVDQTWELNPRNAVFVKSGNQGNRWYRGFVTLGTISDDFQIVIEGVRGASYVSDIAIDDVRIIRECVPEDEVGESETTTEEWSSSEPPISVESCENRCNTNDTQSSDSLITCDCDESCYERNRCCPDYFDFCVLLGTSPDDFTEETTTELPSTTKYNRKSTAVFVKAITPIASIGTSTSSTTSITARKKDESKIIYVKPEPDDVEEVPRVTASPEIETPEVPIKETELMNDYKSDKTFDHQKIEAVAKMSESETETIVLANGMFFGILFAVVGTIFVIRRYQLCNRMRLGQSSNGDSQSDVRFLTSDEVIDFTLASDYDTL